jgi:very-short-patch-repair endonuclease
MPNTYIRKKRKPQYQKAARVRVARWVDPFPGVQGSVPEKMVMAELVRRGIYFIHTPQQNEVGGEVDPSWEPDFLLPQYKIWMEIQGSYFHTLPGAVENDAYRFAVVEAAGWKPVFLWEEDIRARLPDLLNEIPELYNVDRAINVGMTSEGLPFYEPSAGLDHLKGLRKALSNRARPPQGYKIRRKSKRRPK